MSEFWIPIHNNRNRPILDNYVMDNETIPIRYCSFYFWLKPFQFRSSSLLIYFQYINRIRDKKHVLAEQKSRYDGNPINGEIGRIIQKFFLTLMYNNVKFQTLS